MYAYQDKTKEILDFPLILRHCKDPEMTVVANIKMDIDCKVEVPILRNVELCS